MVARQSGNGLERRAYTRARAVEQGGQHAAAAAAIGAGAATGGGQLAQRAGAGGESLVNGAVGDPAAETDDHGPGSIRRPFMPELGSPNTGPPVKWYRGRVPLRAIFFDAGNTLVRIDYAAIAAALAGRGVTTTAEALMRAEWRARVRLDADIFATGEVASTEARTTHSRYFAYVLEGIGVADPALVEAMDAWRRAHNQPLGLWTLPEPDAVPALTLARKHGLRTGVISNSDG